MTEARELAEAAERDADVRIRDLVSLEEADDAIRVMIATWGDHQLPPREMLKALAASGNVFQGAYRGSEMAGFSLGFFGVDEDGFHLHSHMLAVMPGTRSKGVGFALKMAQRAAVLDAGVGRIRWTFDPLVARNAYFNLAKLGAVADSFHRDFYGAMEDVLNHGDRTDRLMVRWDLAPAPQPHQTPRPFVAIEILGPEGPADAPRPTAVSELRPGRDALIRIPPDHLELRKRDPALGEAWREAAASAFEACFSAGLIAVAFSRDVGYLMAPRETAPEKE